MTSAKKILWSALDDGCGVRDLLKIAKRIMDKILENHQYTYAAFHYRSRILPEGRRSPFSINLAETKDKVLDLRSEKDSVTDETWIRLFVDNLLRSYLYIFGRDSSFSENCILATKHRPHNLGNEAKLFDDTAVSLIFRKSEQIPKKQTESTDTSGNFKIEQIEIPNVLYNCLSWHGRIGELMWNAVAEALRSKAELEKKPLDKIQDFDIPEYRMVSSILEDRFKTIGATVPFSLLRARALAVGHYLLESAGDTNPIIVAEQKFFDLMNHRPDRDRDFFLRVVQAASVFTELLGEELTVFSLRSVMGEPDVTTPLRSAVSVRGALTSHVKRSVDSGWRELDDLVDSERVHCLDIWSGLTIYGYNASMKEMTTKAIKALQVLTASCTEGPDTNSGKAKRDLKAMLNAVLIGPNEVGISLRKLQKLDGEQRRWVIAAMAAGHGLRGTKHEGKHLTINIAVGTEVEFRAALAPIYKFRNATANQLLAQQDVQISDPTENLKDFQSKLKTLVRRYHSLLDASFRFICISAKPGGPLELCYIADAMGRHHASTVSETLKGIVTESGFVLARVEPSQKVMVSTRTEVDYRFTYSPLFYCRPADRGFRTRHSSADAQNNLSNLMEVVKELPSDDERAWKSFVDDVLGPTIETVSENPHEGGLVVVVSDQKKLKGDGTPYFSMPEGDVRLCVRPDNRIEYVGPDAFRRLLVQDGAMVVDAKSREIVPRIQLLGSLEDLDSVIKSDIKRDYQQAPPAWGTRHLSALQFVASILNKDDVTVHCFVISQDGDVHYMTNKSGDILKPLVVG